MSDKPAEISTAINLMVHDHVKTEATRWVEAFIQNKLGGFDFSKVQVFVSLKYTTRKVGFLTVKPNIPKRPKGKGSRKDFKPWMESRVLLREDVVYPYTAKLPIRTVKIEDPIAKVLMKNIDFYYEFEDVTVNDPAEAFVLGAGIGIFKILRKLKLVGGRASRPGQNNYGIAWFKEFREWRAAQEQPVSPVNLPPEVHPFMAAASA